MKSYQVTLPITGILFTTVDADSEVDAIEKAINSDLAVNMIEQWEAHEHITQGNVFYGMRNEASAELEYGQDEDEPVEAES